MSKILLSSVTLPSKLIEPREGAVELQSIAGQPDTTGDSLALQLPLKLVGRGGAGTVL